MINLGDDSKFSLNPDNSPDFVRKCEEYECIGMDGWSSVIKLIDVRFENNDAIVGTMSKDPVIADKFNVKLSSSNSQYSRDKFYVNVFYNPLQVLDPELPPFQVGDTPKGTKKLSINKSVKFAYRYHPVGQTCIPIKWAQAPPQSSTINMKFGSSFNPLPFGSMFGLGIPFSWSNIRVPDEKSWNFAIPAVMNPSHKVYFWYPWRSSSNDQKFSSSLPVPFVSVELTLEVTIRVYWTHKMPIQISHRFTSSSHVDFEMI